MTENNENNGLVLIDPIKETIRTHTVAVQINLDEDASDRQILGSLEDVCKEWSKISLADGMLKKAVGEILIAVRARKIYKDARWAPENKSVGTFDIFIDKEITARHGNIKRANAYRAIEFAKGLPNITNREIKEVGSVSKLQFIAQAVNAVPRKAPPSVKERLRAKLIEQAKNTKSDTVEQFKNHLQRQSLIRSGHGREFTRITLEVSPQVAVMWRDYVGDGNGAEIFAALLHAAITHRKPASRAGAA